MEQKSGSPGGVPLMKNGMKTYFAMKICLPVMKKQQQILNTQHHPRKKER